MTPQEQLAARKISSIMRAARKQSRMTQVGVSAKLGISQSALSKMESGILIPSAPQWFEFCGITSISPDSITSGYIERMTPAKLDQTWDDGGFKIPSKYTENRGSKVRAMLPFMNYFKQAMGDERLEEYLWSIKLDPDYFIGLDNQISLGFCLDLCSTIIEKGYFKPRDIPKLVRPVANPEMHGGLRRFYEGNSSKNLLKLLLNNSRQYECNFQYAIEDEKKNHIVMSVRPEKHLKMLNYKNHPVLGDFLCKYKQGYFERFTGYNGLTEGSLEEIECHYKGAEKCVYQLKIAS